MNYAHGGSAVASTDPMKKINFRFDPGIRAQFGVRPKHDDWEFDAVWTHFYAKSSGSTSDSVFPNFYPPSATVSTSTSATWRLNMNVADLELSRATYISKWLSTRPYLSLRGAWIGQKYLINSNGVANSSSDMQSYLYSVGPRGGFDLKFGLGQGLYVFNDSSAAMLWGYFKNTQNTLGATSYYRNMNVHTTTFNVDMSLGLGWDRLVDEGHYRVSLRGSWDHSIYFDANYFASYPALATIDAFDTARGNLSLEGFTFAFRLDF